MGEFPEAKSQLKVCNKYFAIYSTFHHNLNTSRWRKLRANCQDCMREQLLWAIPSSGGIDMTNSLLILFNTTDAWEMSVALQGIYIITNSATT